MIGARLAAERDRLALWTPVAIGLGIAVYFALPAEPSDHVGPALLALAVFGLLVSRYRGPFLLLALGFGAAAVGFQAAAWRTAWVAAPVLEKDIGPTWVTGRIVETSIKGRGWRLVLDQLEIPRLDPARVPARARIKVWSLGDAPVRVGDSVRLLAKLMPPSGPAAPGAHDFARAAYYQRLGAVGFALSSPERSALGEASRWDWRIHVAAWREAISARVRDALPGAPGAVAAALMTGDRGAIAESVLKDLRNSGLAHLLAISGLHIGLIAAVLFFASRAGLALIEPLALCRPIKKWAALIALVGAFGYLVPTGATVPTQRAFVMTALVLIAVLMDRRAISMRLVAWAAALVLLSAPESLLSVSFQMSFAAVVALIAGYETLGPRFSAWRAGGGPGRRILLYVAGVALTTVIASLATAPFAAYHFNRIAHFGLLANLLAVPTMALWIMPWAVLTYVVMPLGLEAALLAMMGLGIEAVLATARTVAELPNATSQVASMAPFTLALTALGGLWLCLWRGRWRLFGLGAVLIAFLAVPFSRPPDILIDGQGKIVALRDEAGRVHLSMRRVKGYVPSVWLRRAGEAAFHHDAWRCDGLGCIARLKTRRIAHVWDARALHEDCTLVAIVLSRTPVRDCPGPQIVLDRFALWREGPHAIWLEEGGARVVSSAAVRGDWPWVPKRARGGRRGTQ